MHQQDNKMRNRYSSSEAGRKIAHRLDIQQLQNNLKKMKKQMETVMKKQKESLSPRHELPVLISQSKLIRCCDNTSPKNLSRSYQAIDRLLKWSVEKIYNQQKSTARKEIEDTPTTPKKPKAYAKQIKLKNSVKKIRQEMNLYRSEFVSLRTSSKMLRKEDGAIHSKKQNVSKVEDDVNPQHNTINNDQSPQFAKQLSVKNLKKKNSRSRNKHSKKFVNVLELINRKVNQVPNNKDSSKIQTLLDKKMSAKKSRSRCYSENNSQGLSSLQSVLMNNSMPYQSLVMDYRLELMERQKQIKQKRKQLESRIRIKSEALSSYVDAQKYVVILDKNKSVIKKVRLPTKIQPIDHNLQRKKKLPSEQQKESKLIDLEFSPWAHMNPDDVFLDNLNMGIENE